MDLELLIRTSQQYKDDTTSFCTWLAEQAATSGYVQEPASTPQVFTDSRANASPSLGSLSLAERLREKFAIKARKRGAKRTAAAAGKSRAPKIQTSTTRDILLQAQAVTNDGVTVPVKIFKVVKRVIDARRRCVEMFHGSKKEDLGVCALFIPHLIFKNQG